MIFFPENCITEEERAEFLKKKQKELTDKADRNLVGEEEEEGSLLRETFRQLGQGKFGGNIYFKKNSDHSQLKKWEDHEKTLNKAEETELIIKPNTYKFENNELNLSNYFLLETVYACGVGLRGVKFDNLPKVANFT